MTKPSAETQSHQLSQKRKAAPATSSRKIQNRTTMSNAAPLYITVGPQCCGKSTLLETMEGGKVKYISLDDQPDVYVSVPTNVFLGCITDKSTDAESLELLQQLYQGNSYSRTNSER
jgi:predicted AAA+ superfamily ATPase